MLGLRKGTVLLVPYTPQWAILFEQEAHRVREALGPMVLGVEHIGSTAVPGMEAKPILDLLVGLLAMEQVAAAIAGLEGLGYRHRPNGDMPGRVYLVKGPEQCRTHHLSLTKRGSPFWQEHLLFRDCLRRDATLAGAYSALKRELARRFPSDRERYTVGKERFMKDVLAGSGSYEI